MPKEKIDRRFFAYLIENAKVEFARNSKGVTIVHIYQDGIRDIGVSYPSYEEQVNISEYFDIETGKIDELISKQEKLIGYLNERRKSVVGETVTKGLNKDIEMKPSGIEWLGDIPSHWKLLPIKSFFKPVTEPAPVGNDDELLSVFTGIGVKPRKEMEERGNKATTTDGYWTVKRVTLS